MLVGPFTVEDDIGPAAMPRWLERRAPDIRYQGSAAKRRRSRVLNRAHISGVALSAAAFNRQEVGEPPRSDNQQRQTGTGSRRP